MLYSGQKNKYSNSSVVRKKILNETKQPYPPPPCKLNGRSLKALPQAVSYIIFTIKNYVNRKTPSYIYLLIFTKSL